MKKERSEEETRRLIGYVTLIGSIITMLVLTFAICSLTAVERENPENIKIFFSLTFLFLTIVNGSLFLFGRLIKASKIYCYKRLAFIILYFIITVVLWIVKYNPIPLGIVCGIYVLSVAANAVLRNIEDHKSIVKVIINIIIALAGFVTAILIFLRIDSEMIKSILLLTSTVIIIVSLTDIVIFSFLRIQLPLLLRIIRRTYAFEIIYGLTVVVIAFSFIFMFLEKDITTYWDALWYSFAVITTIGYGDITVVHPISRFLSVILGFYGIIVVASITSVIVNFYSETKEKKHYSELDDQKEKDSKESEDKEKEDNN